MGQIVCCSGVPEGSVVMKGFPGRADYVDSFSADTGECRDSIDYIAAMILTSLPLWIRFLMRLRDVLVKPFGLKTGSVPEQGGIARSVHYDPGETAVFFTVTERNDSEIIMSEDDKHLYFRLSVYSSGDCTPGGGRIILTTVVSFHNVWGRLYFIPVKPFHRIIVRRMMARYVSRFHG